MFTRILTFIFFLTCLQFHCLGQDDVIYLQNPSFEDNPKIGDKSKGHMGPRLWHDCGFNGETPPDVQPSYNPEELFFHVDTKPQDGRTYLGMVIRDNETCEAVGQKLPQPFVAGKCYKFSIHLARSPDYISKSRTTNEDTNYTNEGVLKVWGGQAFCDKRETLFMTQPITNYNWKVYEIEFTPKMTHDYIMFQIYFTPPVLFGYNGNMLLDNISPIVSCDQEIPVVETPLADIPEPAPVVVNNDPKKTEPKVEPIKPEEPVTPEKEPVAVVETPQDKIMDELDIAKIFEGQSIRIDKLLFEADTFSIQPSSYVVLDEIYQFLKTNNQVVVEIGGHTNNIPAHAYCDDLSSSRAKAVADFLIKKGISRRRLKYKGYGKRQPIATNSSKEGRKKNQRVEIKILSLEG